MQEQTRRILLQAVSILEAFEKGEFSLSYTVKSLEGSIKAVEEKLPDAFYIKFYENWGNLEELNALQQSGDFISDPIPYAALLRAFIIEGLSENSDQP